MKPFDSCALCLQQARDPVACSSGHLYCRECIYTDLRRSNLLCSPVQHVITFSLTVAQRTQIKRQKARIEALQKEEEAERDQARMRARERVLRDFERTQ